MVRVVVVGGGFTGALAAKLLEKKHDVVLIDKKSFFGYIPSAHKLMTHPEYAKAVRIPFKNLLKRAQVITGEVIKITPTIVETKSETFTFDFLVVATGIDYPIFLENKQDVHVLKGTTDGITLAGRLKNASSVVVIGGGLIGTEVAGELATKTNMTVTLVHPHERLLERNAKKAGDYARKFLEKHKVKLIFGEKVVAHEDSAYTTNKGTQISADIGMWCAGVKCNPWFMQEFPESIFTERKALNVNESLQLQGFANIFVGGDITSIQEEKTAQNAEHHAKVIAHNINAIINNQPLTKHEPANGPLLISLGDKAAILSWKNMVITGFLPAKLKDVVEWWVMRTYR